MTTQRVTILGERISIVRPSNNKPFDIPRKDMPRIRHTKAYQAKTIKEHTGKVAFVCVKMKHGGVRGIRKGTHLRVIELFEIDPDNVAAVGWRLENGNYIWR